MWHTLVFLEPTEEEEYMRQQEEAVASVIAAWPHAPRARHPPMQDPRGAARRVLEEAAGRARGGVSMSIAAQAHRAARILGRVARPHEYSQALEELVRRTAFRACPCAREALRSLQRDDIRIGVISNTVGEPGGAIQRLLERLALGEFIDSWAFSDQLPWTKPAPEIFWHCLRSIGVQPENAVHVGDGLSDLVGARRAGLRAGILYTGTRRYAPTYQRLFAPESSEIAEAEFRVESLIELPGLVDELLRGAPYRTPECSGSGL